MNYESIANGEKRIFPYYKGKFLGVTDLGYANKKSAQKFMTQIPDADVYEKLGGEEHYKRTHGYLISKGVGGLRTWRRSGWMFCCVSADSQRAGSAHRR